MFKKLLTNKKRLVITVLFYICLSLFFVYPTPYEVLLPGGIQDIDNTVTIEDRYTQSGTFNSSYVSVITKPSTFQFLISKFNSGSEIIELGNIGKHLSVNEINESSRIDKISSINTAIIVAYKKAGKPLTYDESGSIVAMRVPEYNIFNDIRVGDVITNINGQEIKNNRRLSDIINLIDCNTDIKLTILRDNKKEIINTKKTLKIINDVEVCKLGISTYTHYTNFNGNPAITINDNSGYGSSAGLIQTLSIYNAITELDITHGLKIAGTGVIDELGNVLPIAGIKQKVFGAINSDVDIYFAPNMVDSQGHNLYMEALSAKALKKSDIIIVPVKTFDDALNYLKNYNK